MVPFAAALNLATIPDSATTTFDILLTGNVNSFALLAVPGQIVTFTIQQDVTGGRAWTWPTNVKNAGVVDPDPNSMTRQSFIVRANGNLYPIGPQTYN